MAGESRGTGKRKLTQIGIKSIRLLSKQII